MTLPDDATPEEIEYVAGKLLVRAAKARLARSAPGDTHEIKHLYAALMVGNTSDEDGDECKLDAIDDRLHLHGWGQIDEDPDGYDDGKVLIAGQLYDKETGKLLDG